MAHDPPVVLERDPHTVGVRFVHCRAAAMLDGHDPALFECADHLAIPRLLSQRTLRSARGTASRPSHT